MRAETVHVTDHALMRWQQRASITGEPNVQEIIRAVKESKVIKKGEPLPYPLPRLDGSVYTVKDDILFILESVTIDEYRLVTVICETAPYSTAKKQPEKPVVVAQPKKRLPMKPAQPTFDSAVEEREWLLQEKKRLEGELALTSKKAAKRKEVAKQWAVVENRLIENKPLFLAEKERQHQEYLEKRKQDGDYIDFGQTLRGILEELKYLRRSVEALHEQRSQGVGAATRTLHVQPAIAGMSDMAPQGSNGLQLAAGQDALAEFYPRVSGSPNPDPVEAGPV